MRHVTVYHTQRDYAMHPDTRGATHALGALPREVSAGETVCGARLDYGGLFRETPNRPLSCPKCRARLRRLVAPAHARVGARRWSGSGDRDTPHGVRA